MFTTTTIVVTNRVVWSTLFLITRLTPQIMKSSILFFSYIVYDYFTSYSFLIKVCNKFSVTYQNSRFIYFYMVIKYIKEWEDSLLSNRINGIIVWMFFGFDQSKTFSNIKKRAICLVSSI